MRTWFNLSWNLCVRPFKNLYLEHLITANWPQIKPTKKQSWNVMNSPKLLYLGQAVLSRVYIHHNSQPDEAQTDLPIGTFAEPWAGREGDVGNWNGWVSVGFREQWPQKPKHCSCCTCPIPKKALILVFSIPVGVLCKCQGSHLRYSSDQTMERPVDQTHSHDASGLGTASVNSCADASLWQLATLFPK